MLHIKDHLVGRRICLTILAAALFLSFIQPLAADDKPPNILLIMADDLGAENLPCYGNTMYATPHLDQMAAEGALFENAYASPVCTPTRAMILTGLYPNRTGFLERLDSPDDVEKSNRLPVHLKTFGHLFQDAGYATAIAGKWHLGDFQRFPDQPTSHGFDEHCLWVQYWDGVRPSRYYGPHVWENGEYIVYEREVFGPDHYTDFLIDFMRRSHEREQPFLAYFPMNLIHTPFVTPPGDQAAAEMHYPADLGRAERLNGRMVHYMDQLVGRLLKTLEDLGIDDNTLVIFTGDNGTVGNLVNQLGDFHLRGGKRTMNEAGTRVPFIAWWPGRIPAGNRESMMSLMDMLPTLAAVAGIPVEHEVDGLDLSHNLFDQPGKDRAFFAMAFEGGCYFVRDKHFRLHEDGRFYHIPNNHNETRYGMTVVANPGEYLESRERLQFLLEDFMAIQKTDITYHVVPFGTGGDRYKNAQDRDRGK
ncbi:MAG: sulfatase-like hydrolase/transferase [Planctomycetota bacterium]